MDVKCAYLLISFAAIARGQIPSLGFCPDYLPMAEFSMDQFLGKWYESERYFTFSEVASRCAVTDYAKASGSGRIYVSNEVTNRLTGVKRIINGNLQLVGKGTEGKLQVKYATTPIPTETTLLVLDTDYDNYAVVWSCTGLGPIHAQNAWLMTRDRLPSGPVLQKAYGVLDKFKISRTFFVKTEQEGCILAASDINAANGIGSISTVVDATGEDQRNAPVGVKVAEPEKPAEEATKPAEEVVKPIAEVILETVVRPIEAVILQEVVKPIEVQAKPIEEVKPAEEPKEGDKKEEE